LVIHIRLSVTKRGGPSFGIANHKQVIQLKYVQLEIITMHSSIHRLINVVRLGFSRVSLHVFPWLSGIHYCF